MTDERPTQPSIDVIPAGSSADKRLHIQWKARAEKAERELACLKTTPIYTRFYEAEKRIEELTGLWHNANERVAELERERDEARENYAAEYKLKVGCGSKLIEARAAIERVEELVVRWQGDKQRWADELEAALKEVKG